MMTSSDGTIGQDEGVRRLIVPSAPRARRHNHFSLGSSEPQVIPVTRAAD